MFSKIALVAMIASLSSAISIASDQSDKCPIGLKVTELCADDYEANGNKKCDGMPAGHV